MMYGTEEKKFKPMSYKEKLQTMCKTRETQQNAPKQRQNVELYLCEGPTTNSVEEESAAAPHS